MRVRALLMKRLGRKDVVRGCVVKRRFDTQDEAKLAYLDNGVYECKHCGYWHTTRKGLKKPVPQVRSEPVPPPYVSPEEPREIQRLRQSVRDMEGLYQIAKRDGMARCERNEMRQKVLQAERLLSSALRRHRHT